MTALLLTLATASAAEGFLQVGTGQRILDLDTGALIGGGGLRMGVDVGPVVPFLGGTVSSGDLVLDLDGDEVELGGASWSATAGLRVDLADEEGPAQPFLSVAAGFGRQSGGYTYPEYDETITLYLTTGPGVFLGAGADAFLSERVGLGLEVGGAMTWGTVGAEQDYGNGARPDEYDIRALWTWADLHVVFRFGGGA